MCIRDSHACMCVHIHDLCNYITNSCRLPRPTTWVNTSQRCFTSRLKCLERCSLFTQHCHATQHSLTHESAWYDMILKLSHAGRWTSVCLSKLLGPFHAINWSDGLGAWWQQWFGAATKSCLCSGAQYNVELAIDTEFFVACFQKCAKPWPVSYTHLTLPTIYSV